MKYVKPSLHTLISVNHENMDIICYWWWDSDERTCDGELVFIL